MGTGKVPAAGGRNTERWKAPLLAVGLAGLAFGALSLLGDTLSGIRVYLSFFRPLGSMSGIALSVLAVFAAAWISMANLRTPLAISLPTCIVLTLLMASLGATLMLLGLGLRLLGI